MSFSEINPNVVADPLQFRGVTTDNEELVKKNSVADPLQFRGVTTYGVSDHQ